MRGRWFKFLKLFVGTTTGCFLLYKVCWGNYMTNLEYLAMSAGIGVFFSALLSFGDLIEK
jgi:hypothetical protein